MKLSDQVCTIEQAKRLKELGVLPLSFWIHDELPFSEGESILRPRIQTGHDYTGNPPAFSVAELGVMLPEYTGDQWFLEMYKDNETRFLVRYVDNDGLGKIEIKAGCNRPTEAEARAGLLIYLLETKLITAEEVNKRLQG